MSKNKKKVDSVILIAGHSIILGHKPNKLEVSDIMKHLEEHPQDIEQFGLFDSSSPNYTTYYPDVSEEDLMPKDGEFIEPIFRMLSNVTVHAKFNPIYFPADVLKRSMKLLVGQTVNVDHEWAVGNAIGSVKAVEWQEAYKDGNITIPAGINAVLKIDGKSNPRIARGVMMDPPSIHSNSVTVTFEWVKSHPDLSDEEFWNKLGTFDKSGDLIQRIVTKVVGYHETSLVAHGADPFAKRVKDGKIVQPKQAKARYPLSADLSEEAERFAFWDWKKFDGTGIVLNDATTPDDINNQNSNNEQNQEDMDFLKLLETIFGLEADSLTEENVEERLKDIKPQFDQFKEKAEEEPAVPVVGEFEGLEAIEEEMTRLQEIVSNMPEDLEAQLELAGIANTYITELKAETTRLYKLTVEEGKEDATILALIEGADIKTLKSLHKQYDETTEGEFNFTCNECGSHDVTRASAQPGSDDEEFTIKSNAEIVEKHTKVGQKKMTINQGAK